MKKKILLFVITISTFIINAEAQNNYPNNAHNGLLAFELGASVNYYYGMPSRNFGKFENDRLNWEINGMLGITIAKDRADHRTMIAAFGGYGFNNDQTISNMLTDQQYTTVATSQAGVNNSYRLEGGIVIADLIRISTGAGQQNFNGQNLVSANGVLLNAKYLKYNSSTVGVKLNLGLIAWTINCNFEYGQDFNKTVITPSTGLMFRF